jgi:protein KTI12
MALVTIVGYPCSGKSTRSTQLKEYFERRLSSPEYGGPKLRVVVVDDEGSHVPRTVYDGASYGPLSSTELMGIGVDSRIEKSGRANLYSAVTRFLGQDTLLICDSMNYIKGFRYQMYCAAREAHARVCTVSRSRVCPRGIPTADGMLY